MSVLPCGILLSSYQAKHEWLTHLLLLSHKAVSNSLPPCGLQPDFPVPHNLPKFARVHVHWVSDTIQPLLPSSPHAFSLSQHQGPFQWVGSLYQVAKVLELQLQDWFYQWVFSIDFLSIDWVDLLAVQQTLKSLLQHHNLKASVLWCSAILMVQLSHPYMTTGKTIALLAKWCLCFLIHCLGLS